MFEAAPPRPRHPARRRGLLVAADEPRSRPVLHVNASPEAEQARTLLDAYDIDYETRHTDRPAVQLQWNRQVFTDIFGVADFLAVAGRTLPSLRRTGRRRRDEGPPGTRIPLAGSADAPS